MSSFVFPFGIKDIDVAAGELVAIGSKGAGRPTLIYYGSTNVNTPRQFYQVATLDGKSTTLENFAVNTVVRIESKGQEVEYDVGAHPRITQDALQIGGGVGPVSYVAPAATWVTYTASTDAGNLKLKSAGVGVHSLTNAIAVGKALYITWAGGTVPAADGFYDVLEVQNAVDEITIDLAYDTLAHLGTPTVALAGNTVTLAAVNIEANTLGIGGSFKFDALFTHTNSANNKSLIASYGGTNFLAFNAINKSSTRVEKELFARAQTTLMSDWASTERYGSFVGANVTLTEDITVDQWLLIQCMLSTANTVCTLEGWRITAKY